MISRYIVNIIPVSLCFILLTGCSSRMETPVIHNEEGTVIYIPKDSAGIGADIILYKGIDEATGLPLTSRTFTLGEKSKVYAAVRLLNRNNHRNENLMFHLDWIDKDGNSFFMKRVDIPPEDAAEELSSAISIQPGRRDTGNYKFRVYLFRELIAERNFTLASYNVDSADIFSKGVPSAEILLGSRYDRKKDTPSDTGSVFIQSHKARIYAGVNLPGENLLKGKELDVGIEWTDSKDSAFFSKRIYFSQYEKLSTIRSSISVNNKSREPGNYKLRVYLYGSLIKEKPFTLVPEKKKVIKLQAVKGIKADITFCSRFSRKTKKLKGISDSFILKNKSKVHAVINIKYTGKKRDIHSKLRIEWVNPEDRSFYTKTFKLSKKTHPSLLSSSISISPRKRNPGDYKCRVFFNSSLISEKTFTLTSPPL